MLKIAGIDVKNHMSSITEEDANKIEKNIKGVSKTKSMDVKKSKNDEPVIIRRAIINNDDEQKEEEKRKKEQQRKKDVGFIENKRNKDYNIVYRDKPTKPLTVSELLGLGKKKEKNNNNLKENVSKTPEVDEKAVKDIHNIPSSSHSENKENVSKTESSQSDNKNYRNNNYANKQYNNKKNETRNNYRKDNSFNNRNNLGVKRNLDEKGIDKRIKNIIEADIPVEKDNVRDFSNKGNAKDKAKFNRQDEQNVKKVNRKTS